MVGGMTPARIDRAQTIAARAPAAPMRCPVIDFGADTARSSAAAPNAVRIAAVSVLSLAFVDVPVWSHSLLSGVHGFDGGRYSSGACGQGPAARVQSRQERRRDRE